MSIAIADLLLPIRAAQPAGEAMSFSPEFDAIKEARRFDDPSLDQGAWETPIKDADWPRVVQLCSGLLARSCKDLQLAAWLTEALAKTRGFAGLADGYRLMAQLSEDYWPHLHPLPEQEGDYEQRIGRYAWLLFRSTQLVREIPLTRAAQGSYSAADFESARALAQAVERAPGEASRLTEGRLTLAQFEQARRNTPYGFYSNLMGELAECGAALAALEAVVDAHLGADGPSFSQCRNALEAVSHLAARFAKEAGVVDALGAGAVLSATSSGSATEPEAAVAVAATSFSDPIQTRSQAVAQLRAVADYFRKAEPHSPVAYLAEKAAHWSNLPLHVWLRQVLKEPNALAHVEELLGLPGEGEAGPQ